MDLVQNGFGGGVNPNGAQSGAALTNLSSVFSDLGQQQMRAVAIGQAMRAAAAQKELGSLGMASGAPDATGIATYLGNGGDPKNLADTLRLTHSLYGGVDDPIAAQAAAGGGNFTGSPLSQQRAEANTLLTQKTAAQITADAQVRTAGMEPVNVINPDGSPGLVTKATLPAAIAHGARPVLSPEQIKGAIQLSDVFGNPGAGAPAPAAAPPASGGLGSVFQAPAASMPAGGTFPAGTGPAALASAPAPMPMARAVAGGYAEAPKFGEVGVDPLSQAKIMGYPPAPPGVAPLGGASPSAPAAAMQTATSLIFPPGSENLHGHQYLQAIAGASSQGKEIAAHVQGILDAKEPPLDIGNAGTKPEDRIIMAAVRQADPTFDATQYPARAQFRIQREDSNNQNSIASGQQMIDTTLNHLLGMSETGAQMPGQTSISQLPAGVSHVLNSVKNEMANPDAAAAETAYNGHLSRATAEAAKFFGGAAATDSEKAHLHALFDTSLTPPERNAAIGALVQDLMARASVMQNRNDTVMGPNTGYKVVPDNLQKIAGTLLQRSGLPGTGDVPTQVGNGTAPAPVAAAAPAMQRALSDQAQDALEAWDKSGQPPEVIAAAKAKILQRLHTGQ